MSRILLVLLMLAATAGAVVAQEIPRGSRMPATRLRKCCGGARSSRCPRW